MSEAATASGVVSEEQVAESPNVDFTPVVSLPEVDVKTLEEDEEEIFKIRARLFRYASEISPPEWKERGIGDVRMLKKEGRSVRILMRRDKTLKICANHYITSEMELRANSGSDRAWVYTTFSDFADEEVKTETLAIRFANATNANLFKDAFESAKVVAAETEAQDEAAEEKKAAEEEAAKESDAKPAATEETQPEEPQAAAAATEEEAAAPAEASGTDETAEVTEKLGDMKVEVEESKNGDGSVEEEASPAPAAEEAPVAEAQEA